MADEKKVIKVKDLIIQAENVYFEPIVREGRVAPPRVTEDAQELELRVENDQEAPQRQQRPPFSWI